MKAVAGDTVLVSAGAYPGTSVNPAHSGTLTSRITFTARPGVVIAGGTRAFALSGRSNIVISGFAITGTSSYGISVSGGSDIVISHNTETRGIFANPRFAGAALGPAARGGHRLSTRPTRPPPASSSPDVRGKRRGDDRSRPNTGAGRRPYGDRGAYEFQP